MATQIDLENILLEKTPILSINSVAPTARDILFQKNLMLSKNLQRSPIYTNLLNVANENFNSQYQVDDTQNLNTILETEWTDNVGGFNQKSERENHIYQNQYRDATQTQYYVDNTALSQTNSSEINQYVNYKKGTTNGIINSNIEMTSDNVGSFDQKSERENQLYQNTYLDTDKNSYVINDTNLTKKSIDYVKRLKAAGFDINTNINKNKLDFSWKDSLTSLGSDLLQTVGQKFSSIPIQSGYTLIKNALAGENESQIAKDGLKGLINQLGYNIAQNTSNQVSSLLDSGLDFVLHGGKDEFQTLNYEITTGSGSGILKSILTEVEDLTGLKEQHHIPLDGSIFSNSESSDPDLTFDYYSKTNDYYFNPYQHYQSVILNSGNGQANSLINNLKLNKYRPPYKFNKKIQLDQEYEHFYNSDATDNDGAKWSNLSSIGKPEIRGNYYHSDRTLSRFSWEEGGSNVVENYFDNVSNNFDKNSILGKTRDLIKNNDPESGKLFENLLNRNGKLAEISEIQTGVNVLGEISRGNNVLNKSYVDGSKGSYPDGMMEFCRVWTFHDQYDRPNKFIRANSLIPRNLVKKGKTTSYSSSDSTNHSVLENNGFLKIAPYSDNSTALNDSNWIKYKNNELPVKKYMFSIENLAWSDKESLENLHPSEIGNGDPDNPNIRGRIMWFPPYNLKINKSVNSNLTKTDFVGRGESVITYNNTTSNLSLSFTLLADHPSLLNEQKTSWLLKPTNSNEKDGDYGRFFSGCGTYEFNKIESNPIENKKPYTEIINKSDSDKGLFFVIFFPNDLADTLTPYLTSDWNYEVGTNPYPSGTKIPIDTDRWSLSAPLIIGNSIYDNKTSIKIENKLTADKKFTIQVEPDYKTIEKTDKVTSFTYNLNVKETDSFKITSNGKQYNKSGKNLIKSLFYLAPGEVRDMQRRARYWEYKNRYGLNDDIVALINKTKTSDVYKQLKDIVNNANESNSLFITIQARASIDASAKSWGTGATRVNGFLAARRANTVLNEVLPKVFQSELDISKIKNFTVKIELFADTEKLGKNDIISKDSTRGRRVYVNIATTSETIKELSTNSEEKLEKRLSERTNLSKDYYRKNLPNEVNYFQKLNKDTDKIIWEQLTEKVKFFHPVFHSQTPESLSSRLTFLEQCMRQGPTLGGNGQAYNLAFGKQPTCILRIGDFIHTKVYIESLSIDYDQNFDLNPEGIGVQPMLANVTLNIIPIGGQDISGPINQLQNAVSFNYYANTSIFDPRASTNKTLTGTTN